MAMNIGSAAAGTGLAGEIKAEVATRRPQLAAYWTAEMNMDWVFDSIATAVVEHILNNMVVVTEVSVENNAVGANEFERYPTGEGTGTTDSATAGIGIS